MVETIQTERKLLSLVQTTEALQNLGQSHGITQASKDAS